ncbi:helix-turn-helix domain-containing protein [Ferribacterium limneticum]|uniref:helix-turn-helix domain-containing protein n=1 Tax=Ferribacterium limneticum TaxID=76259 RepID=UPI001CFBB0B3|nr:helix-turn-helix transcriptional regulator [Ferribacterium limneticum]
MSTSLPSQRFAVLLRKHRRDRGLSQETLAERAGLHRNFISLIERGVNQPSIDSLFQLALALEISPIDLVREIGEMAE